MPFQENLTIRAGMSTETNFGIVFLCVVLMVGREPLGAKAVTTTLPSQGEPSGNRILLPQWAYQFIQLILVIHLFKQAQKRHIRERGKCMNMGGKMNTKVFSALPSPHKSRLMLFSTTLHSQILIHVHHHKPTRITTGPMLRDVVDNMIRRRISQQTVHSNDDVYTALINGTLAVEYTSSRLAHEKRTSKIYLQYMTETTMHELPARIEHDRNPNNY